MKSSYLKSKIGGAFLTLSLLFGGVIAMGVTTQAQYRDQYGRRDQRAYEREQRRRQREQIRQQRRNERVQDRYGRNDGYYGNNGYGNDNLRQTALNAGYNNGIKEGRKDRSRNERYEYRDEGDYQKATEDYSSRLGNRETYRQYFRQGFANGYRAGYENGGYYGDDDDYRRRGGGGIGDILGGILGRP